MKQSSTRLSVILNPGANAGRGLYRWKNLLTTEAAKSLGLTEAAVFDGSGISSPGGFQLGLKEWMRSRLSQGSRDFVAAGGDGTVHLALNQLMEIAGVGEFRLGAIGLGSSNDFHKPFDAPGKTWIIDFPCRLDFQAAFPHDVGRVTVSGREPIYFCINSSVGITAEANAYFNEAKGWFSKLKRRSVDAAIIVAALRKFASYRSFPLSLKIDQQEIQQVEVMNLGIVKNPHFSGSFRYDLPIGAADGVFGVHLCHGMHQFQTLRTLIALSRGRFQGLPKTESWKASEVSFLSDRPFALETDGEVIQTDSARLVVIPKGVYLCPS